VAVGTHDEQSYALCLDVRTDAVFRIAWNQRSLRFEPRIFQALGPRFTLPDFHDAVLRAGSVPLDVLSGVVQAWTAAAATGGA
jgi:hypothetical protein